MCAAQARQDAAKSLKQITLWTLAFVGYSVTLGVVAWMFDLPQDQMGPLGAVFGGAFLLVVVWRRRKWKRQGNRP
jgi:protein-S-isoprenylcysteine O-methyltransferase Ste14